MGAAFFCLPMKQEIQRINAANSSDALCINPESMNWHTVGAIACNRVHGVEPPLRSAVQESHYNNEIIVSNLAG